MLLLLIKIYLIYTSSRFLFYICMGLMYRNKAIKASNYSPLVSIIIPAWNEEVGIEKTILSIVNNGYTNFEIICVDDGSTDKTSEIVIHFRSQNTKLKKKIKLIKQHNSGKAFALNNGIKKSRGEIIITVDADSYLEIGAIEKLINELSDDDIGVSIGKIVVGNTESLLGLVQYFEYSFGFHYKQTQDLFNSIYIFPGAFTAIRKSIIKDVGYFESYSCTEDLDLSLKIKYSGYKVKYVNDALCVTEGATTLRGLLNQRTRWRHGYLNCLMNRPEFVFNIRKGVFLTFIELPLSFIGILEMMFFPIIFFYLMLQIFTVNNLLASVLMYFLLPYVFILIMLKDRKNNIRIVIYAILIPIFFTFAYFIEIIALFKSYYRLIANKKTRWTIWQRSGLS